MQQLRKKQHKNLLLDKKRLLKEIKRTVEVLKTGEMEEIGITTGFSRAIVRVINDDFFLVLALDRDGNYGKGRYLLKRVAPKLQEELS